MANLYRRTGKHLETTSRGLEKFLWAHGIRSEGCHRDRDGRTVWRYTLDSFGERVLEEWREVLNRRRGNKQ